MSPMRAGPDASFMFEHGQWATRGAGLRQQLDLAVVEPDAVGHDRAGPEDAPAGRTPRSGGGPSGVSDSLTSQIVSDEWVWMPVSNSSASATASAKHSGEQ